MIVLCELDSGDTRFSRNTKKRIYIYKSIHIYIYIDTYMYLYINIYLETRCYRATVGIWRHGFSRMSNAWQRISTCNVYIYISDSEKKIGNFSTLLLLNLNNQLVSIISFCFFWNKTVVQINLLFHFSLCMIFLTFIVARNVMYV